MKRIPLHARDGSVRAFGLVDDEDYDRVRTRRWCLAGTGYVVGSVDSKMQTLHRFLLQPEAGYCVDHINRDRLDNRRENLRLITRAASPQNVTSHPGSTSRFRGVSWDKSRKRWLATAQVDGVAHYLGYFHDEVDAARAAQAFRDEHMPFAQPDPELLKLDEPTPLRPAA